MHSSIWSPTKVLPFSLLALQMQLGMTLVDNRLEKLTLIEEARGWKTGSRWAWHDEALVLCDLRALSNVTFRGRP